MLRLLVPIVLTLSACDKADVPPQTVVEPNSVEERVSALEDTVAELKRVSIFRTAFLRLNEDGYVVINTTGGLPIRVGLGDIEPRSNGS